MGKPQRYFAAEPSEEDTEGSRKKDSGENRDLVSKGRVSKDGDRKRKSDFQKQKNLKGPKEIKQDPDDPFPNVAPVEKKLVARYSRGKGLDSSAPHQFKTAKNQRHIVKKDQKISEGVKYAARTELLLSEEAG